MTSKDNAKPVLTTFILMLLGNPVFKRPVQQSHRLFYHQVNAKTVLSILSLMAQIGNAYKKPVTILSRFLVL